MSDTPRRITSNPPKPNATVCIDGLTMDDAVRVLNDFARAVKNDTVVPLTYHGILFEIMSAFKVAPIRADQ